MHWLPWEQTKLSKWKLKIWINNGIFRSIGDSSMGLGSASFQVSTCTNASLEKFGIWTISCNFGKCGEFGDFGKLVNLVNLVRCWVLQVCRNWRVGGIWRIYKLWQTCQSCQTHVQLYGHLQDAFKIKRMIHPHQTWRITCEWPMLIF